MGFLINPNVAYLLVVAAVMLILLTGIHPKSTTMKVGMVFCLAAAGVEFLYLKENPWAFLVVVLSPLPFFFAINQAPMSRVFLILTFLMLLVGSFFLFVDEKGLPIINYGLAGIFSVICGKILWSAVGRMRNREGGRVSDEPDSVVGMIGETHTAIEAHSTGSVLLQGQVWQAYSTRSIPAGSTVRVLRQDGAVLIVKPVQKITKDKK